MKIRFSNEPGERFALNMRINAVIRLISAAAVVGFCELVIRYAERGATSILMGGAAAALFAWHLNWTGYVTVTPTLLLLSRGPRDYGGLILRSSIQSIEPRATASVDIRYTRNRLFFGPNYVAKVSLTLSDRDAFLRAMQNPDWEPSTHGHARSSWKLHPAQALALVAVVAAMGYALLKSTF